ncbi:MAG: FtsX-like permease family protein [Bacteroidota bacterium]
MITNYLKIGYRNLLKYKAFSFINIFGLAVAMSVCMLMILMYADQLSYDQFHSKKDRIYRLVTTPVNQNRLRATIPFPVASKLKNDYSIVEETVLLRKGIFGDAVFIETNKTAKYTELKGYFSNPSFLKVFSYPLASGDPNTALNNPNSLIISHKKAVELFGNENALGKTIRYTDRIDENKPSVDWGIYTITGVFAENEHKSHLQFDAIFSASSLDILYKENKKSADSTLVNFESKIENLSNNWDVDHQAFAYVLLRENANQAELTTVLNYLSTQNFKQSTNEQVKDSKLTFQRLSEINPGPVVNNADVETLPLFVYYILGGLVLVILLASILNYMSLSVARSFTRSGEIGLRKVIGAQRKDLIFQFLSETFITVFLSLFLANLFLVFLKKAFLGLWINQYLKFDLNFNIYIYIAFFIFCFVISFISGIYPALKLSRSNPIAMIRKLENPSLGKWGFRRILTVSQFSVSLLFIVTSIVIHDQFKYYMQFDYGFNPKNVVNINLQSNDYQLVKNSLRNIKGIKEVSASAYLPSTGRNDGLELKIPGKEKTLNAINLTVDQDFVKVLEIPILHGKNLVTNIEGKANTILVNEAAAKEFGFKHSNEIVGQNYLLNDKNVQVAGVFKDFTFFLLFSGRATGPIVLHTNPSDLKFINVKIESNDLKSVVADISNTWKIIDPIHPMQLEYYEDKLANTNRGIFDLVSVIGFLAFLAITISCLGLLGMAIYTTERRTKEIGIRKVLGATELSLNFMLSKEFLKMLGIAILIAAPLSFYLNNLWLNFMAVRENISIITILFGSAILLVLGLITVVPQTFRIAKRNPVESLKTE